MNMLFDEAIDVLYRHGFSILAIAYVLDIPIEDVQFALSDYFHEY